MSGVHRIQNVWSTPFLWVYGFNKYCFPRKEALQQGPSIPHGKHSNPFPNLSNHHESHYKKNGLH